MWLGGDRCRPRAHVCRRRVELQSRRSDVTLASPRLPRSSSDTPTDSLRMISSCRVAVRNNRLWGCTRIPPFPWCYSVRVSAHSIGEVFLIRPAIFVIVYPDTPHPLQLLLTGVESLAAYFAGWSDFLKGECELHLTPCNFVGFLPIFCCCLLLFRVSLPLLFLFVKRVQRGEAFPHDLPPAPPFSIFSVTDSFFYLCWFCLLCLYFFRIHFRLCGLISASFCLFGLVFLSPSPFVAVSCLKHELWTVHKSCRAYKTPRCQAFAGWPPCLFSGKTGAGIDCHVLIAIKRSLLFACLKTRGIRSVLLYVGT